MSYTYSTAIGDGVTVAFPFSFAGQDNGYISVSNIHVYVAGTEVSFTVLSNDPNKVYLSSAPPVGAEVLIRRIMPKDVPYSDFSRGNPFSQDTLNSTNLQQLYIVQEIFDGYLPQGFFFRTDIDMGGHKFYNLGDGVDPGDSVNFGQLTVEHDKNTEQDGRLTILEDAITTPTIVNYLSQLYVATGGEVTVQTTNNLHAAAVYIQGLFQFKADGAYTQSGGTITFSEPLLAGQKVYFILGSDLPAEALYPSIDDFLELQMVVTELNNDTVLLDGRVTTIEALYAKKGANSDITSLSGLTTALSLSQGGTGGTTQATARSGIGAAASGANTDITSLGGLTTPLSVAQGGTGGATPAAARNGISAAVVGSNNDITSLTNLTGGITGLTTSLGPAASGIVGQVLEVTGTGTALTTATPISIASLALPAGDWEVYGVVQFVSTGNMNGYTAGVTTSTSAYLAFQTQTKSAVAFNASATVIREVPVQKVRTTAGVTVYMRADSTFSSGTVTATAYIRATRVR